MADQANFEADELRIQNALKKASEYLNGKTSYGESMSMQEDIIRRLSSSTFAAMDTKAGGADSNEPVKEAVFSPNPLDENFDLVAYLRHKMAKGASHGLSGPEVSVLYEDLEIFGDKLSRQYIPTYFNKLPFVSKSAPIDAATIEMMDGEKNRRLMAKTSGFFKPGEMTLVLGRPGAGCSTFLREIAGVSRGLSEVRGKVSYNGFGPKELREKYPSMVVYNPEDDAHYPMLTVSETLRFALRCRVGQGSVTEGKSRDEIIEERLFVILKMLGLMNCKDTMVGDENTRGCSGGERKRVSLAEQWCLGASVGIWDGSTKGLDSSTALDFIRALRTMTDLTNTSQIVSIYQASEEIYDLFDRVVLIADGRVIYFGPAKEAPREFFKTCGVIPRPRATTPDFLTGVLVQSERLEDPDRPADLVVPTTAREFEAMYLKSPVYAAMKKEFEDIKAAKHSEAQAKAFREDVMKRKIEMGLDHKTAASPYFTSWSQQFNCTAVREIILAKRDMATVAILIFDTIMSVVAGFIFMNVELTEEGYNLRAGVLYFALAYMCFNCLASVPLIVRGRAVSGKHKTYRLYRTELQVFATQLTNAPAIFLLSIFYALGNYWLVGLDGAASRFFTFIFTNFLANQAFGSVVRLIASVCPDIPAAIVANSVWLCISTTTAGYALPFNTMSTWIKVFFWANPLQYALRALFQNEFSAHAVPCEGPRVVVPFTMGQPDDLFYVGLPRENFACKITGANIGDTEVQGTVFIDKLYGFNSFNLYWSWLILLGFVAGLYIALILVSKYFGALPSEYSIDVWKKKLFRSTARISEQQKKQDMIHDAASGKVEAAAGSTFAFKPVETSFTWKHIDYTVVIPATGEHRQLLKDVQGFVKSGEMVALMGSSGAGKTTLIDCLTQRKTTGDLTGQIYVRDKPQGHDFKSMTAYCEQMDVHNPYSTVKETIRFAARLRQDASIPLAEKNDYADYIMHLLELEDVADALVGKKGAREGISMEQQKRLTIACELASTPEILFLAEPTSGLDSQAAFHIVRLLRKLTDLGQAVLCTIHQPSAVVFAHFDKVLLLARGGQTVYFGELGQDSSTMIDYFVSRGAEPCDPAENPAEWMLNVIGAGITTAADFKTTEVGELMDTQWWVKQWAQGDFNDRQSKEIDDIRGCNDQKAKPLDGVGQFTPDFCCGIWEQFIVVLQRMVMSYYRNPNYTLGRCVIFAFCGLWVGFAFYDQPNSVNGVQNKGLATFIILSLGVVMTKSAEPNFHEHRAVFLRERATGVYSWFAFASSIVLAEIPFTIVSSLVLFCCFYWPIGFSGEWHRFAYFYIMYFLFSLSAITLGQCIMACVPTMALASSVTPFATSTQLLLAGIALPYPDVPKFFRWIYWINPYHYFMESVLANEVGNTQITCDPDFAFPFKPKAGMTCGEYMAPFFKNSPDLGQLYNPESTDTCLYCKLSDGNDMLKLGFDWTYDDRWRNFGMFFAFLAFNVLIILFMTRAFKGSR